LEIDLHVHSRYSPDSRSKPEDIVRRAIELGLGAIAVTDHDSLKGAAAATELASDSLLVVPGMEIKTERGDLLALFVSHEVKSRTFATAVDEIRSDEGLAIVPHPGESPKMTKKDIALADGLEVFNATLSAKDNRRSLEYATELRMPGFACSDAHMVMEIGNGTTKVQDSSTLEELRKALLVDPVVLKTNRSNLLVHRINQGLLFGTKGIWLRS
jgi:predicted metal-dependent phosphoesterase TrpH